MKTMKKRVSWFLTLAMVISLLVIPMGVSAADGMAGGTFQTRSLPISDDFSVVSDYFNGKAKIEDGVLKIYKGAQDVTWKLTDRVSEGTMEMSMTIKAQAENYLILNVMDYHWWTDMTDILTMQGGKFSVNGQSAEFVDGETYQLVATMKPATGDINVKVFNPDTTILLEADKNRYYADGLQTFMMQGGWDSETEIIEVDNLSMKITAEAIKMPFTEDFTNLATLEDIERRFVIDNTKSAVSIVDLGGERGNVVALTGNAAAGLNVRLDQAVSNGKVKLSTLFCPNGNYYTFRATDKDSFGNNEITAMLKDNTLSGIQLTAGTWYKLTSYINLDASPKTISSTVTDMEGTILWNASATYTPETFKNFGFRGGWDATTATYFDDIQLSYTASLPQGVLFSENFDALTDLLDIKNQFTTHWTGADNLVSVADGKLAITGKGTQGLSLNMAEVTSGAITWSMDVTPNNNYFKFMATDAGAARWDDGALDFASIGDNSQLHVAGGSSVQGVAGTTYKLNILFDLEEDVVLAQWLDGEGKVLTEGKTDYTKGGVANLAFMGNWTANSEGNATYFDNITVKTGDYYVTPGRISKFRKIVEGDQVTVSVDLKNTTLGENMTAQLLLAVYDGEGKLTGIIATESTSIPQTELGVAPITLAETVTVPAGYTMKMMLWDMVNGGVPLKAMETYQAPAAEESTPDETAPEETASETTPVSAA